MHYLTNYNGNSLDTEQTHQNIKHILDGALSISVLFACFTIAKIESYFTEAFVLLIVYHE